MSVYYDDFETDLGNWAVDPSSTKTVIRNSGGTPSRSTGPSSAYSGSYYIFTEGSDGSDPACP